MPKQLVRLGDDFTVTGGANLERLAHDELDGLTEKHFDQLIMDASGSVGDALKQAGLLHPAANLKPLAFQVALTQGKGQRVILDVLMAEVLGEEEELVRLVIFEDKLFRNPESRRKVVAQAWEYAQELQELDVAGLKDFLPETHAEWLHDNADALEENLQAGDFLVVICGDDIRERLHRMVTSFNRRLGPQNLSQLAVLALPIYSNGTEKYLVPHVIGSAVRSERSFTLRVQVRDARNAKVAAAIKEEDVTDMTSAGAAESAAAFESQWEERFSDEILQAHRTVMQGIRAAAISGLQIGQTGSGAPTVDVDTSRYGMVRILHTQLKTPVLADGLHGTEGKHGEEVARPIEDFRRALLSIGGSPSPHSTRVHVPVEKAAAHLDTLVEALRHLCAAFREAPTG